jgi:hypothetical protein
MNDNGLSWKKYTLLKIDVTTPVRFEKPDRCGAMFKKFNYLYYAVKMLRAITIF